MQNRWARRVVVGLIVVFPLLVAASVPGQGGLPRSLGAVAPIAPIAAVEVVLVGGLVFAARERRRLLVELDAARTRPRTVGAPSAALTGPMSPARRYVPIWIRR